MGGQETGTAQPRPFSKQYLLATTSPRARTRMHSSPVASIWLTDSSAACIMAESSSGPAVCWQCGGAQYGEQGRKKKGSGMLVWRRKP